MSATSNSLAGRGLLPERIFLSMERHMECGIGLCGHCQMGRYFVCQDGPVFSRASSASRSTWRASDGRAREARPLRVGVVKFASCDGCQLAFLGLGPALLDLGARFAIVEFGEASSDRAPEGPFDILLRGGLDQHARTSSITSATCATGPTLLVTIGACATSGGIQALRGWAGNGDGIAGFVSAVYPTPEYVDTLATATPIADHVPVDAELRGCPIDGGQLVELLTATAIGRRPQLPNEAVCVECKRRGPRLRRGRARRALPGTRSPRPAAARSAPVSRAAATAASVRARAPTSRASPAWYRAAARPRRRARRAPLRGLHGLVRRSCARSSTRPAGRRACAPPRARRTSPATRR